MNDEQSLGVSIKLSLREITGINHSPYLIMGWIIICVLGRLLPHPANVTPLLSICLFAGAKLSRKQAIIVALVSIVLSDIGLSLLQNNSIFGTWSFFTYSAYILIVIYSSHMKKKYLSGQLYLTTIVMSLGYWIWTNFGTWLLSSMYPHTISGFATCYLLALPFLQNSLLGDIFWTTVIWGLFYFINQTYVIGVNYFYNR